LKPPHQRYAHLDRMTDQRGLFQQANGSEPVREGGYTTDDHSGLLVLIANEPICGTTTRMRRLALNFVLAAQDAEGLVHNKMTRGGRWLDEASSDDAWGRAVWGLGTTAVASQVDPILRRRAHHGFNITNRHRSTSMRAMSYAILGAIGLLAEQPGHQTIKSLVGDGLDLIGPLPAQTGPTGKSWNWPEPRLGETNALLAEALIAGGSALSRTKDIKKGLEMLDWLLDLSTTSGHLSAVGAAGRGPGEVGPQFEQQPTEVAALGNACFRAAKLTDDPKWLKGVSFAGTWFMGINDAGIPMFDEVTGGGFDGLTADGVNQNQSTRSTIAFLMTVQRMSALAANA
jgi:hypothetical protein